jgi:hypothetical protein
MSGDGPAALCFAGLFFVMNSLLAEAGLPTRTVDVKQRAPMLQIWHDRRR